MNMEEILNEIAQEPAAVRFKNLRESCLKACGQLYDRTSDPSRLEPWQLRDACLVSFKIALESRSGTLASLAVAGLQRMISDDRFCSNASESASNQLPVQFLHAISSVPSLSDEVQVEVMKLLLLITCSASCEVHGEDLIAISELCIETFARSHQNATKTTCRATLSQLMTFVGLRLQDSNGVNGLLGSAEKYRGSVKFSRQIFVSDVILLLKHFSLKILATNWSNQHFPIISLYLESVLVILGNLPIIIQEDSHFCDLVSKDLCPALVHALSNPMVDGMKKGRNNVANSSFNYADDHQTGRNQTKPNATSILSKSVYMISIEILRLVGTVASLRPSLETLFHRILLYPPPQERLEALRAMKEVLGSSQRLLDLVSIPLLNGELKPSENNSQMIEGTSSLDMFRMIMTGIRECCHYQDASICNASIACAVALLGALEDIANGRGITLNDLELLDAAKDSNNWLNQSDESQILDDTNAASCRDGFDAHEAMAQPEYSDDEADRSKTRPKHIRWKMDFECGEESPTDLVDQSLLLNSSKTVRWAAENKEHIIDNNEKPKPLQLGPPPARGKNRNSNGRKSSIPRCVAKPSNQKLKNDVLNVNPSNDTDSASNINSANDRKALFRSRSAIELRRLNNHSTNSSASLLRRSKSASSVDCKPSLASSLPVEVDQAFFEQARKRPVRPSTLGTMRKTTLQNGQSMLEGFQNVKNRSQPINRSPLRDDSQDDMDNSLKDSKLRHPRPILRRVRSFSGHDRQRPTKHVTSAKQNQDERTSSPAHNSMSNNNQLPSLIQRASKNIHDSNYANDSIDSTNDQPTQMNNAATNGNSSKPKSNHSTKLPRKIPKWKALRQEDPKSPSKETTINGIPLSKLPRQSPRSSSSSRQLQAPKLDEHERETAEEMERDGARNFARCLLGVLPSVIMLTESEAVDEALQQFASDICEAVSCMALKRKNVPNFGTLRKYYDHSEGIESGDPILNADCVYLTVYASLGLNYKLHTIGYYQNKTKSIPVSKDDFLNEIDSFGVEVGLSRVWLLEMYRLVTTYDILAKAGFHDDNPETNRALIKILAYTFFPTTSKRDAMNLQSDIIPTNKKLGSKFSKRLLLSAWESILEILSVPLDTSTKIIAGNGSIGLALMLGSNNCHDHVMRERDMICLSLDGLRRAARLCCTLDIPSRCEVVLSLLAEASCADTSIEPRAHPGLPHSVPVRLHAAHVLSMDALLAAGLELGGLAPSCWRHVFRCCLFISHLQNCQFQSLETSFTNIPPSRRQNEDAIDRLSPVSDLSYLSDPASFEGSEASRDSRSWTVNGVLNPADARRAIYALSAAVENLFDTASTTLNLNSLCEFMKELVASSRRQLVDHKTSNRLTTLNNGTHSSTDIHNHHMISTITRHMYHICDVMLKCSRNSKRPLLHIMSAWIAVSQHLTEMSCCKNRHVTKIALTTIHDITSELLRRRNELVHFWFHESLFKPFDDLMALDLCEEETQDQILYTIYELVEGFSSQIKSGWRTLLSALRNTQIFHHHPRDDVDDGTQRQYLVFQIIKHFVNSKNTAVFTSAAVECILSLLRYVRGGKPYSDLSESNDDMESEVSSSVSDSASSTSAARNDLCQPALNYLDQISKRLSTIYIQPSTGIFNGSFSIFLVDPAVTQGMYFDDAASSSASGSGSGSGVGSDITCKASYISAAKSICAIDDTGILRVWFLLIEGLTHSVASCPRRFQSNVIELLFDILKSVATVPGPHFALFAVTHLLLPTLQTWVNRGAKFANYWHDTLNNFKQACGLATQLVVDEMTHFMTVEGANDCVPLLITMLLDLLVDCVSQPNEAIARLGCSCIRHLLLSAGPQFNEHLWQIVCKGIRRAFDATLTGIKDLIHCYQPGSVSITGGENGLCVKVVARKDTTVHDAIRLQQMAEQVFLLESQISADIERGTNHTADDKQRVYIFILSNSSANDPDIKKEAALLSYRVSFRSIVVGLLANQILLHMLGSMLLENSEQVISSTSRGCSGLMAVAESGLVQRNPDEDSENPLPGLLCHLSPANLSVLFGCLRETHEIAHGFNSRPGIRYLIQRLLHLPSPANLLRQSITAFAFYLNTLFHISRHDGESVSISHIKRYLNAGEKINDTFSCDATKIPVATKDDRSGSDKHRDLLKGDRSVEWMVRRLYDACNQLSEIYSKLHHSETIDQDSGIDVVNASNTSTPSASPHKANQRVSSSEESLDSLRVIRPHSKHNGSFDWITRRFDDTRHNTSADRTKDSTIQFSTPQHHSHQQQQQQHTVTSRRLNDDDVHLNAWTHLVATMLESLLALPTLQFKTVLPAVFPSVTSLITNIQDERVRQLVCDVVRRCGTIYGIV